MSKAKKMLSMFGEQDNIAEVGANRKKLHEEVIKLIKVYAEMEQHIAEDDNFRVVVASMVMDLVRALAYRFAIADQLKSFVKSTKNLTPRPKVYSGE